MMAQDLHPVTITMNTDHSEIAWNQVWNKSSISKTYSFTPSRYERSIDKIGYWIQSGIEFNKNETVLEAGCGDAAVLIKLMRLFEIRGYGVDFSDAALLQANHLAKTASVNPDFKKADCRHMPFESNFFDKVISLGVVEHMQNIKPALTELYRVMRPGGTLILMTPNRWSAGRWQRRWQMALGQWPYGYQDEYSPCELVEICHQVGLYPFKAEVLPRRKMLNEASPFSWIRRCDDFIRSFSKRVGFYSYVFATKEP